MKETYGIINRPIGKSPSDFRRFSATRGAKGEMREAETWWTMFAFTSGFSLIEAEPKTGRTHQIRVHFKAINHPIVSDPLYGAGKPQALGFERTALHAASITFTNCKGKEITVKAPLPKDFLDAFREKDSSGIPVNAATVPAPPASAAGADPLLDADMNTGA
jgi:23S rRNA pseudouridine1911/1915/1917 synthase